MCPSSKVDPVWSKDYEFWILRTRLHSTATGVFSLSPKERTVSTVRELLHFISQSNTCTDTATILRSTVRLSTLITNSRSKDGKVTVIAKTAFSSSKDRELLRNGAHVFDTLSSDRYRHMQQEWWGLNMICGLLNPVPVRAVVPKFYGYYVPEDGASQKNLSPMLLMEDCGTPVKPEKLSDAGASNCSCYLRSYFVIARDEIYSLFLHLHNADYVHHSAYVRSILAQPGPLTRPPIERSMQTPGFRLIDFGRAQRLSKYQTKASSIEKGEGEFSFACQDENRCIKMTLGLPVP